MSFDRFKGVPRVVALASVISAAVSGLCSLVLAPLERAYGIYWPVWLVTGLASVCLAQSIEKRWQRLGWREVVTRDSLCSAAGAGFLFLVRQGRVVAAALVALAWVVHAPSPSALPHPAQVIFEAANCLGQVWLGGSVMVGCLEMVGTAVDGQDVRLWDVFAYVFERVAVFLLMLAGIQICSGLLVWLVAWMLTTPQTAIEVGLGLLVAIAASRVASPARRTGMRMAEAAGIVSARRPLKRFRSAEDVRRTCIHEVGHLLMCAALPDLPTDLEVAVASDIGPHDRYLGYVSSDISAYVPTASLMRWIMLTDRAGAVAEEVFRGESTAGAREDVSRWTGRAHEYLACGFGEPFYESPSRRSHITALSSVRFWRFRRRSCARFWRQTANC